MNQEQVLGFLRIVLPVILAYAVGKGYITEGMVSDLTAAIVTIAAGLWSVYSHAQSKTVAAIAAYDTTRVSPDGKTITLLTPALANSAKESATPPKEK